MPQLENKLTSAGGTTATIKYSDDSETHDSNYFTFSVYLCFDDPDLNPPNQDVDGSWFCGSFYTHHSSKDLEERIYKMAEAFFNFLMSFRTAYGNEVIINNYIALTNSQRDQLNRQEVELRKALFRAEEAELKANIDYVKSLENKIETLKEVIGDYATKFVKTAEKMVNDTGANVKNDR